MYPAPRMRISHVPTAAATLFKAFSSVTLTVCTELGTANAFCVSRSLVSSRPIRTSLLAPARAKDMAVARPMPLPWLFEYQYLYFTLG